MDLLQHTQNMTHQPIAYGFLQHTIVRIKRIVMAVGGGGPVCFVVLSIESNFGFDFFNSDVSA